MKSREGFSEAMKRSTYNGLRTHFSNIFSEEEFEVSEILIDLPNLISESVQRQRHRFSITWGGKRRRSALNSTTPSPCRQRQSKIIDRRRAKAKAEATSPSTPLSFCPSESDEKSKDSLNTNSKKRTRDEWLEIIGGLTQSREFLRGEVETLRNSYQKLNAVNLELKAKKQKLSCCLKAEKPRLGMNENKNLGMKLNQHYSQITMFAQPQQQLIIDHQNFRDLYRQRTPMLSSYSGLGLVNQMGPRGIPDLNVSAEGTFGLVSSHPLDLNRVLMDNRFRAAEARKRRMIKLKECRNSSSAMKQSRCR